MSAVLNELRLGAQSNGLLIEPWEFDDAKFDPEYRYDLVNGVLIVSPSPLRQERDPNEELGRLLRNYQEDHPEGSALDATVAEETVHIGQNRRRVDRAIWAGLGRLPGKTEVPTIAVEFVSEGSRSRARDYKSKVLEYRRAGVREYWIIDRFERRMTVHLFDGMKAVEKSFSERQSYSSALLPGFKLAIGRLLAQADRWDE